MAEAIAAQMFAAIPAGDHDQMATSPALQHLQDDRPRARLAIIGFDRALGTDQPPAVMRGAGEFLCRFSSFEQCSGCASLAQGAPRQHSASRGRR